MVRHCAVLFRHGGPALVQLGSELLGMARVPRTHGKKTGIQRAVVVIQKPRSPNLSFQPIFLAHHPWGDRTGQSKLPTPLTLSILSCNVQPLRCILLKADESHVSHASKVQSGNLLYSHFFFTIRVAKEPSSSAPVTVSRVACPDSASTCHDKPSRFVIFFCASDNIGS